MANSSTSNNSFGAVVVVFGGLVLMFVWLTIPAGDVANGLQIVSLAFANSVFVGWADDIAASIFSASAYERSQMITAYREAILAGERNLQVAVLIFTLLGTFLSIGGVIAVLMARSATSYGQAFAFGFFAEIAEGVAWHLGYFATVGRSVVSMEEIGMTLIVAIIMGFVAMSVYSKAAKVA